MNSRQQPSTNVQLEEALSRLDPHQVEQIRCFRIGASSCRLVSITPAALAQEWATSTDDVWIDIQASHPLAFRTFLEPLDLHPLILEDCLDAQRSSRFSSYDTSLHFEVPVTIEAGQDHYLSVICLPRILITIRTAPIPEVDHVMQDLDHHLQLNAGTKSALLYAILDELTDHLVQAAADVRLKIRELFRAMDSRPESVDVEQIVAAKRIVQDICLVAEDQLFCVSSLIPVDSQALQMAPQRDYLRDAARNYEAALRVLQRYASGAAELHQQYHSSLQAKTEARLRILTILSSICMPLTLIAGIYGMNFARMPELRASWGYPVTLTAMAAIAVGQLLFFYKRGWFG